jgi:two-component system NtrC family response regulator
VVDDELTPRSIITRMVQSLGYAARSCRSGRDALRWLEQHPREARLLVADLGMPNMDGGELVERALDLDPGLRVLILLSPGDPHAADLLPGYRDLPCLTKPVSFGDLARKLEELLGPAPRLPLASSSRKAPRRRRGSGQQQV